MSHVATNWAINQMGLKPATKIVLWWLADCHHPEHGCFPSQQWLAEKCEMTERSVRNHLDILEERGLIRRVPVRDGGRFGPTRYILAFEAEASEGAEGTIGNSCRRKNLPSENPRAHHRKNFPPNPVREPVKVPPPIGSPPMKAERSKSAAQSSQPKRGCRIPDDWALTEERLRMAEAAGLRRERAQVEAERFLDYWRSVPGARGVKLDWEATWRNWCRRAAEGPPWARTEAVPKIDVAAVARAAAERLEAEERRLANGRA